MSYSDEQIAGVRIKGERLTGYSRTYRVNMDTITDDRYVVLLGKLGNGISSTGNTLLGRNAFKSKRSMRPVTLEPRTCRVTRNGRTYHVVDTPGFFYPGADVGDILRHVQSAVKLCPTVHAFLIVYSGVSRISEEESVLHEVLSTALGRELLRHAIAIFTHGNEFPSDDEFKECMHKSKPMTELVNDCNGLFCKLDNKQGRDNKEVENLFQLIESVSDNGRVSYAIDSAKLQSLAKIFQEAFANKDDKLKDQISKAHRLMTPQPKTQWSYYLRVVGCFVVGLVMAQTYTKWFASV